MEKIDLKEIPNPNCHKKCNKDERKKATSNDLCNRTLSITDDLPIRCVGGWALEKIYHLVQYFGIFSTGMKDKWGGKINYIEICSGPGRCINRDEGVEFNGTSLSITEHSTFKYVNKALFFDYSDSVIDALNHRIKTRNTKKAKALFGDYNKPKEICKKIKSEIPNNALNLVFIDPTDCSIPFELVRQLKQCLVNMDVIINIALRTDYNRNIVNAILNPTAYNETLRKYSIFLDNNSVFKSPKAINLAKQNNNKELRNLLREEYINSLKKLGYLHFDFKSIRSYYDLIFATSHPRGIDFWKKANKIQFDGQRSLDFGI